MKVTRLEEGATRPSFDELECLVPPSPELEAKILRTQQLVLAGEELPAAVEADILDLRTYTLIKSRPVRTRAHTFATRAPAPAPVVGTRRALVLLVDFSDQAATESQQHYSDMLFSVGTYNGGKSMRDFYREASYNKLDVQGSVSGNGGPTSGWYRAPRPKSYYTNNDYGFGSYPRNAQKLVEDLVDLANPFVNFADYDNDGDGVVEALIVIAAGTGGEASGNKNDIWSHAWGISPKTVDGVQVRRYFMGPEDGKVGVMSHELGHLLLNWPDLYDTDYSSAGTGRWDLMAGGSWNGGGDTPAHPTCWCKQRVGWINPVTILNNQQDVTIRPYATHADAYKLPAGGASSKEYFLVTNRQKTKFDSLLPGEGCIIEHVDDNMSNNTDESHYLVNIEQADGNEDLNKNANRGDANDPYPTAGNTSLTSSTTPNSLAYDGTDHKISVTDVKRAGDNITASLAVNPGVAAAWHNNKAVRMTYATPATMAAWAHIDTLGWRRVKDQSPDGVTNVFIALCEALGNGRNVHVYADGSFIYRVYLL